MHPLDLALVRDRVDQLQREARRAALARQVPARSGSEELRAVARGTRAGLRLLASRARGLALPAPALATRGPAPARTARLDLQACCA